MNHNKKLEILKHISNNILRRKNSRSCFNKRTHSSYPIDSRRQIWEIWEVRIFNSTSSHLQSSSQLYLFSQISGNQVESCRVLIVRRNLKTDAGTNRHQKISLSGGNLLLKLFFLFRKFYCFSHFVSGGRAVKNLPKLSEGQPSNSTSNDLTDQ